jgi:LPS sulfotransferase NodH
MKEDRLAERPGLGALVRHARSFLTGAACEAADPPWTDSGLQNVPGCLASNLLRARSATEAARREAAAVELDLECRRRSSRNVFLQAAGVLRYANIPVMAIKGAALAELRGTEGMYRTMADVDILVRSHERAAATRALEHAGFERREMRNRWHTGIAAERAGRQNFSGRGMEVDLHWRPRFLIGGALVEWDADAAWERRAPFPGAEPNGFIPAPHDLLACTLLHAAADLEMGSGALYQLVDTAWLWRASGGAAPEVAEGLRRRLPPKGRAALDRLLEAAAFLLEPSEDAPVPPSVHFLLGRYRKKTPAPPGFAYLAGHLDARTRFRYLAGYLFPNPAYPEYRALKGASRWRAHTAHQTKRLTQMDFRRRLPESGRAAGEALHSLARRLIRRLESDQRFLPLAVRRRLYRTRLAVKYLLKRHELEPLFILCTPRTGSNLLKSYLNSIPGVSLADEILHPDHYYGLAAACRSKEAVRRHILLSLNNCRHTRCGAKLFLSHLEGRGLGAADLDAWFPRARFIILYRRDFLRQYVSYALACRTQVWQAPAGRRPAFEDRIRVDRRAFAAALEETRKGYERVLSEPRIRPKSVLVSYEELAEDPQGLFRRSIFPFLGLPPSRVRTPLVRQSTAPLSETVENYDELAGAGVPAAGPLYAVEPAFP